MFYVMAGTSLQMMKFLFKVYKRQCYNIVTFASSDGVAQSNKECWDENNVVPKVSCLLTVSNILKS